MKVFYILLITSFVNPWVKIPKGVQPVSNFELDKYLGKWYEIARLDHSFERNLNNVTATYSMREDGGVKVINKGLSTKNEKWKVSEGKAYFVREQDEGYLKVSFFGPFYASYIVFELDKENYEYAFVTGPTKSFLWLLSRTPAVSKELLDSFLIKSKQLGYNTDNLIFVDHE